MQTLHKSCKRQRAARCKASWLFLAMPYPARNKASEMQAMLSINRCPSRYASMLKSCCFLCKTSYRPNHHNHQSSSSFVMYHKSVRQPAVILPLELRSQGHRARLFQAFWPECSCCIAGTAVDDYCWKARWFPKGSDTANRGPVAGQQRQNHCLGCSCGHGVAVVRPSAPELPYLAVTIDTNCKLKKYKTAKYAHTHVRPMHLCNTIVTAWLMPTDPITACTFQMQCRACSLYLAKPVIALL